MLSWKIHQKRGYFMFSWKTHIQKEDTTSSAGKDRIIQLQFEKKRILQLQLDFSWKKSDFTTLAGKEEDIRASAGKKEAIRN